MADENNQAEGGGGSGGGEKTVPYDRFQKVVTQKNELATQMETLRGEVQSLTEKAATADTLSAKLREAEAARVTAETRFQSFKDISSALGTTDGDAIEAAEWQWSKLPAKDRPKVGDWLTTLKAEPDKAPAVLRPWLKPEAKGQETKGGEAGKPNPPKSTTTTTQAPGAPAQVSAEELRKAREVGVTTGDWTKYKELKKAAGY